jgi:hypothetical protein
MRWGKLLFLNCSCTFRPPVNPTEWILNTDLLSAFGGRRFPIDLRAYAEDNQGTLETS